MKQKMKVLLKTAIVLGILGVFVFSAAQATAYAECPPCTTPPNTACKHLGLPGKDEFCHDLCMEYFCESGFCYDQADLCICTWK